MKILADRHIPWVEEFFAPFGELSFFQGQPPEDLAGAEGLIVRTTVKVDRHLFRVHQPKFVASPTAGTDHLDVGFLKQQNVPFFYAPGCNALAVAQWVISSLVLCYGGLKPLEEKRLGIIGLGQVGSRLHKLGEALGCSIQAYDPPKQESGEIGPWAGLEELLSWSDIVSLHVPKVKEGTHQTLGMIDAQKLSCLKDGGVLINSSRGGVVDEAALMAQRDRLKAVILDTWSGEPQINRDLCGMATFVSPHIAGYSHEAKFMGTQMIATQVAQLCALHQRPLLGPFQSEVHPLDQGVVSLFGSVSHIPLQDRQLRDQGDFAWLRNHYPLRHQWESLVLSGGALLSEHERSRLEKLGFSLDFPGSPERA